MCLEFGTPVVKVVSPVVCLGGWEMICDNMHHVNILFSFPSFESCERFQRK